MKREFDDDESRPFMMLSELKRFMGSHLNAGKYLPRQASPEETLPAYAPVDTELTVRFWTLQDLREKLDQVRRMRTLLAWLLGITLVALIVNVGVFVWLLYLAWWK